jgi:hemerythrin-like domain-containing protein
MDAIGFLKREHETAKEEFARLEQASKQERGPIWRKLRPELELHEQTEEAALYEPLSHDADGRDTQLAQWNQHHAQDVREAQHLLREIEAVDPEDDRWLPRVLALRTALEHHIEREEREVFPRIALVWNRDRLDRAGADLERMQRARSRLAA